MKNTSLLIGGGLVLLVAGVAAYFLLKKKDESVETVAVSTPLTSTASEIDTSNSDSIISQLSLSSNKKSSLKKWVKQIRSAASSNKGGWSTANLKASAKNNGVTYEQQLVIAALWQMYQTSNEISSSENNTNTEIVKSL
ncbi:MAG: hypothetical protein IIX06_01435 [Bacteroidales bacterium]|nr:hypothetical protein [Bacteroidales bacterium]